MSIAVEGDNPKKILEETELIDYSAIKTGKNTWNVSFGKKVTVEDVKALDSGRAFHKSRWFMNQVNIYHDALT
jgi:hypothetical protein